MGRLKNPRRERFAREIVVNEVSQTEAYRRAFEPSDPRAQWVTVQASRVANNPNVVLRIDELTREAAARVGATPEWAISKLHKAANELFESVAADDDGPARPLDAKTATSCVRLIADMCGWIPKGSPNSDDAADRRALLAQLASIDPDVLRANMARPVSEVLGDPPAVLESDTEPS